MNRNSIPKYEVGDRVLVHAILNGWGEDMTGTVIETEMFMGRQLLTIDYDHVLPDGSHLTCAYSDQQISRLRP